MVPTWLQNGPTMVKMAPRCLQDGTGMVLRCSRDGPRWPQDAPGWPNMAQTRSKTPPKRPKDSLRRAEKRPQVGPRLFQDGYHPTITINTKSNTERSQKGSVAAASDLQYTSSILVGGLPALGVCHLPLGTRRHGTSGNLVHNTTNIHKTHVNICI
jgi:hypothetical protein